MVAIFKPPGLLVHRSEMAPDKVVVTGLLRQQLGRKVWPVHRLDRACAGILIFALSVEAARALAALFQKQLVVKTYLTVVRGFCPERGSIDHPLSETSRATVKKALTHYQRLGTVVVPHEVGRYASARYSLVRVTPKSGRYHQIRKHFHHISHHIVGDTVHGDGCHNRFFREHFGYNRLWLLSRAICFIHPLNGDPLYLQARLDTDWKNLMSHLGWKNTWRN